MITINIGRKEAIFFGAIILVFVVAGFVIAYNSEISGGTPSVMGHSADEVMVKNSTGSLVGLQTFIDQGGFGGSGSFVPSNYNGQESVTFPNGLILKTGAIAGSPSSITTVSFAQPFPNATKSVVLTVSHADYHFETIPIIAGSLTASGFQFVPTGSYGSDLVYWTAIGY